MLVLKKFAKDKPAVFGSVIVIAIVLIAVFADWLAPYPGDASASHLLRRLKPPSWAHPFGTDNLGRDIFSRVILGTRGALMIAIMVVGSAMLVGVPLGLVGGYYQGFAAEAIMRVTDMFLAVPQLILALALAQLMTPSLESAMLALSLTYWPFFTRIVYSETRRLKASLFIDALQCIGASGPRILFLHILPNCISPIIVRATIAWASRSSSRQCSASSAWARRRPRRTGASPSRRADSIFPTRGGSRPSRGSPSSSPSSASTSSETA